MDIFAGLLSIVVINLLLSGDNALVIALASRRLAEEQRKKAILLGSAGAIILRVLLVLAALPLLELPYLRMAGGLLLLWIAIDLVLDENADNTRQKDIQASRNLWGAVKTILVADLVMSLDNVVAIVAAAQGNVPLLLTGLAISVPIIVWGSGAIMVIVARWPQVIIAGAAFLGWIGGEMFVSDEFITLYMSLKFLPGWAIPAVFAAVVLFAEFIVRRTGTGRRFS